MPLPSKEDRLEILRAILSKKPLEEGLTAEQLESSFDLANFSGADLNNLVQNAAKEAAWGRWASERIQKVHFEVSAKLSKASLKPQDIEYYESIHRKFK